MKNRKKRKCNGFTLLELLAVILVLSIIGLIAFAAVNNSVKFARKKSAETSAHGYIYAVNNQVGLSRLDSDTENDILDGTKLVSSLEVKMEGKAPNSGYVVVTNGTVSKAELIIGEYKISCNEGECTTKKATFLESVEPGLIDLENEKLLVSWDDLVNEYGMDLTVGYGGAKALAATGLTGFVKFPPTVTSICSTCFRNNKNITGAYIPSSVKRIGAEAFNKSPLKVLYFEDTSNWYAKLSSGDTLVTIKTPEGIADKISRKTSKNAYPMVEWYNTSK